MSVNCKEKIIFDQGKANNPGPKPLKRHNLSHVPSVRWPLLQQPAGCTSNNTQTLASPHEKRNSWTHIGCSCCS